MRVLSDDLVEVLVWDDHFLKLGYILRIKAIYTSSTFVKLLEKHWAIKANLFVAFNKNKESTGACLIYHHIRSDESCRAYVPRLGFWGDEESLTKISEKVKNYCKSLNLKFSASPKFSNLHEELWIKHYVTITLDENEENQFNSLRKKTRYMSRKSEKILTFDTGFEYVTKFYALYKNRMTEKKINIKPLQYFKDLLANVEGAKLFVALKNGEVISGMIFCELDGVSYYLYNSASEDGLQFNANHFLMWKCIQYYAKKYVRRIYLGESREGSGTFVFKKVHFNGQIKTQPYTDIISNISYNEQTLTVGNRRRLSHFIKKKSPFEIFKGLESYDSVL